jgi:hypothetical protein
VSSKWINKDLFNEFVNKKLNEKDKPEGSYTKRSDLAWRNPEKGTVDKPNVYVGRFVPDPKGQFYKKYFYHMFQMGEQWIFFLCPKTFHFENFCPWCSASSKLYTGTKADKEAGYALKRKEKFVANWFVIDDPRDKEADEENKVEGTIRVWEFPGKVEKKLKEQVTDKKNGLGYLIFEPGEEGFDFILKIASTKRDKNNREFPEYSLSEFGRRPHPIADTEEEIDKIMKQTIDLDLYLEGMQRSDEDTIEILKRMMVWDIVASEWKKSKETYNSNEEDIPDFSSNKEDEDKKEDDVPFDTDDDSNDGEDLSDDALLRELENL